MLFIERRTLAFSVRGVWVFVHWTAPLIGLGWALPVWILAFTTMPGSGLSTLVSSLVAALCVVVTHEMGHVVAAKVFALNVRSIGFFGTGGICVVDMEDASPIALIWFYAAGFIAQFLLITGA